MRLHSHFVLALVALRSAAEALAPTGSLVAREPEASPPVTVGYGIVAPGSQSPSPSPSNSTTEPGSSPNAGQRGDSRCVTTMCVEALVVGNNVQYTLRSQRASVGWMAIGYGSRMARTPMVIMWANEDGTVTLSQRQAASTVEPSVVANPPLVAAAQQTLSVTSGNNPSFVFTIPANGDTRQNLIYAFGSTRPSSSAPDARLIQHIAQGTMTLDLSNVIGGGTEGPSGTSSLAPLTSGQRMMLAHGIIAALGFILFLPIGALLPRYLRTFVAGPTWFKSHWIVQFLVAGITIIIGVALGFAAVGDRAGNHMSSTHHRVGLVLFVLYFVQLGLGAVIHWIKPKRPHRRPPQNYIHAILGLLIIGLSLYQVRSGFRVEWPRVTGRDDVPNGVNIVWYIWVVLLPVAYAVGMAFLPKQYAQERKARESAGGRY